MKILFWNIHGNAVCNYVARCAAEHGVDIICLAEHQRVDPEELCNELDGSYRWVFGPDDSRSKKVVLFARDTVESVADGPLFEQSRYIIWTCKFESVPYNIVALHMVDKMSDCEFARHHDATRIMADLHLREEQSSCSNSIIIGDFNADPHESSLLAKDSFHATLFKDVLRNKSTRRRADESFTMMYNPILHFLSEDTKCYGSYYRSGGFTTLYWHCYDQALVSRTLLDSVEDLQYLRSIDDEMLVRAAGPNVSISDHLPLLLTIKGE